MDALGLSSPPPPCCSCSSLLPRLLAAHRMEVRRLLRGALASLSRRLDSLERRSRRRKKHGGGAGSRVVTSSCSSSSSSLSNTDSPPPPYSFSQSEQRQRRSHDGHLLPANGEWEEKEEERKRFVGQMAVSIRGGRGKEEMLLILHDFNHRKRRRREGGASQSDEASSDLVRRNGYSFSSQHSVLVRQSAVIGQTCGQSEAFPVCLEQWIFSDIIAHLSHNGFSLQPRPQKTVAHFNPTPMLHLSAVAMETVLNWAKGGACWSSLHPLRDWTAPPSIGSDHCYIRRETISSSADVQVHNMQWSNQVAWSLQLPRRQALPLSLGSANGMSAALSAGQSGALSEFYGTNVKLCKRVSQIRIRRASPRETPLTPMGLPKARRLKKKEFSLEEIYTNQNYEAPPSIRSLETIFEEPREKGGAVLLIGQQKRRRILLFSDYTQPRKRKKPQGVGLPVSSVPRKRAAVRRHIHSGGLEDAGDLDVMLVERLSELDDFLTQQGLEV